MISKKIFSFFYLILANNVIAKRLLKTICTILEIDLVFISKHVNKELTSHFLTLQFFKELGFQKFIIMYLKLNLTLSMKKVRDF